MALAMSGKLDLFYNAASEIKEAFNLVMKGNKENKWESSGLSPANAFTTTLVIRAFGFLKQIGASGITSPSDFKHNKYPRIADKSLNGIINHLLKNIEERFRIFEYPTAPAIVYWFIDGIQRSEIDLGNKWEGICTWASHSFLRQLSRVSSKQEILMDPIAMAMAACLCAKLRKIAKGAKLGCSPSLLSNLPSTIELENSINALFIEHQSECGIWPKYFPLFHYPDAGSNYCFAFEMLEAILNEFGYQIILKDKNDIILQGLEKAIKWCDDNRFECLENTTNEKYSGWNSGGQITTIEAGIPESWATAVVHMFLHTLQEVLTDWIENLILKHYKAEVHDKPDSKEWDRLLDINIEFKQTGEKKTAKEILNTQILQAISSQDRKLFRHNPISSCHSALLFGPPGTSKTAQVKALSQKLGWPYIAIGPSHFLSRGLENIYSEADIIFEDLLDLSGVVILFDEMDALVQTRQEEKGYSLDVTSRFLTTSMLPKLAALHDKGRSIFFMATNYQKKFDQAIKRPGRFDLLLCMWPPSWKSKLEKLNVFYEEGDVDDCRDILQRYVEGTSQKDLLEKFTFGEMKAFIDYVKGADGLKKALEEMKKEGFLSKVDDWSKFITLSTNTDESKVTTEMYLEDRDLSRLQL